ncbi:hypothetical protein BCR34DRAFT_582997 [Clohesyomyces aquaticus]|uniref:Uncharacterized protein n=1 Tax=Clohesyomyces aquaticus TaxID=1231657 RepID=A0A1Y2A784_9PLEO|nr:hypothetical protein BCR34DRAFT_582997 [Clohesyomyces aquaticus]
MFDLNNPTAVDVKDTEAACRPIFEYLMERCTVGTRGAGNFRISRKSLAAQLEDDNGTCQVRMENVIQALRKSKCVCRDIIEDDLKIIRLVHMPARYLKAVGKCSASRTLFANEGHIFRRTGNLWYLDNSLFPFSHIEELSAQWPNTSLNERLKRLVEYDFLKERNYRRAQSAGRKESRSRESAKLKQTLTS